MKKIENSGEKITKVADSVVAVMKVNCQSTGKIYCFRQVSSFPNTHMMCCGTCDLSSVFDYIAMIL